MQTLPRPSRWSFKWSLTAAGAAVVLTTVAPSAGADPAPHTATQDAVTQYQITNEAPGAGITVRDHAALWSVASGSGVIGQARPIGRGTRAHIGSLTKTYTAAMVLQLVAEGRVALDTSVETYLPGVVDGNGYDGSKITVRQLLNHTSGIADYMTVGGGFNPVNQLHPHTLAEVASWGLAEKPLFAPGTSTQYSDTNAILAGMIIEKVTGHSYAQELATRITTPLGLADTYLPTPGDKTMPAGSERGYLTKKVLGSLFFVDVTEVAEPSVGGSGGGLVSSGADQTRFLQALLAGQVVPPAQLAEMLTVAPVPDKLSGDYFGLGLVRFTLPCGGQAWGHYGEWPGYTSIAAATTGGRSAFATLNVTPTAGSSAGSGSGGPGMGERVPMNTALCDQG
ncbi:MAG TPA: serine hydrolase domain-containing protein [Amycolatopsis sp.]